MYLCAFFEVLGRNVKFLIILNIAHGKKKSVNASAFKSHRQGMHNFITKLTFQNLNCEYLIGKAIETAKPMQINKPVYVSFPNR